MENKKRIGNVIGVCIAGLAIFYAVMAVIACIVSFTMRDLEMVYNIGSFAYILGVILAYLFIRHFSNQLCMLSFSIIYTLLNGRSALFYLENTINIVCCVVSIVLVWIFWIMEARRSRNR